MVNAWTHVWTPEEVAHADDPPKAYSEYVRQTVGTPGATVKDLAAFRKKVKKLMEDDPRITWHTMCRVAQWARQKRKRPAHIHYLPDMLRYAWSDGYLPELSPDAADDDLEEKIGRALGVETDEYWRRRLIASKGVEARAQTYSEWRADWQDRGLELPRPVVQ